MYQHQHFPLVTQPDRHLYMAVNSADPSANPAHLAESANLDILGAVSRHRLRGVIDCVIVVCARDGRAVLPVVFGVRDASECAVEEGGV
jgi:hypothetical protein